MRIAPYLMVPITNGPVLSQACREVRNHRWPEGLPSMLLLSHPLNADRHIRVCAGDQRSIRGCIVRAVVSVTTGAFHVNAANVFLRQAQHLGDGIAVGENALR